MRFDHVIVAVVDLERAIGAYRSLGFDVFPGGRHEHRGTHNALIRFADTHYMELLGVYDRESAVRSGPNGGALAEFLGTREGGLVGHCYATQDIEAEAVRMREAGIELVGPFEMKRERPDGRTLTWRLLVPVDIPWRRRWPFFIQWDASDEERASTEGIGKHPNGARSVTGVSVMVRDLDEATSLYSTLFEAEPRHVDEIADLVAERATFNINGFSIELLAPVGEGPAERALERDGEGPVEVTVETDNLDAAAETLARSRIETERAEAGRFRIPDDSALGAGILITESAK